MKRKTICTFTALFLAASLYSCSDNNDSFFSLPEPTTETKTVTTTAEPTTEIVTAAQQEVGYEGMTAIKADDINDGKYDITVDSSSTMFKVTECKLSVENGSMTAVMTMSGSGYEYLFMGTGDEAEKADKSQYIPAEEDDGTVRFTVPVEALDKEIDCAAFSKRKELWYDRKLVFRADSIPISAFKEGMITSVESLGIKDGEYTVEVKLEGGSGKATVTSPAKLVIKDGKAEAEIVWSSNKYDYMIVNDQKILPTSTEEFSVFSIPVTGFDYRMPVSADTTAMSTPHEISYTLYFDSETIK